MFNLVKDNQELSSKKDYIFLQRAQHSIKHIDSFDIKGNMFKSVGHKHVFFVNLRKRKKLTITEFYLYFTRIAGQISLQAFAPVRRLMIRWKIAIGLITTRITTQIPTSIFLAWERVCHRLDFRG